MNYESKGPFLLIFGLFSWCFPLFMVAMILLLMARVLYHYLGYLGVGLVGILALSVFRGLLRGLFAGEVSKMVLCRHKRKVVWLSIVAGLVAASFLIPATDKATGSFEVRATTRAELRAPVAGFLETVNFDEGEAVEENEPVVRLRIPDLSSRIAQKDAELREAEAKLELLRAGPRKEEIVQQRRRVQAAQAWRDVVAKDLQRQTLALEQNLIRFDKLLNEYQAECDFAKEILANYEQLDQGGTVSKHQCLEARKKHLVFRAQYEKTHAEKRARAALGTLTAESELAERQKELTIEEATLVLLEAGTRPEEIKAAEATVSRLKEEADYLCRLRSELTIYTPVAGCVTTPQLKEQIGTYFESGELICEVEEPQYLEIMIELDEDQAARVQPGQTVRLKPRSLPFEVFQVEVQRISPRAVEGELQSTVMVYCRLEEPCDALRSGMTGHARIDCGGGSIGNIYAKRFMRFLRTEFWW